MCYLLRTRQLIDILLYTLLGLVKVIDAILIDPPR